MLDTIFLLSIEGLSGKKLATHIGQLEFLSRHRADGPQLISWQVPAIAENN